jgi:hypothetical protein
LYIGATKAPKIVWTVVDGDHLKKPNRRRKESKMKTEFLKEVLKDIPEDKRQEVIDKIFAENGKDVKAAKDAASDVGEVKRLNDEIAARDKQLKDLADNSGDAEALKSQIADLQKANQTAADDLKAERKKHAAEIANRDFDSLIDGVITAAKAKNTTALKALLDIDALKASKNQTTDIEAAITKAKEENDYLFESDEPIKNVVSSTKKETPGTDAETTTLRSIMGLPTESKGD